VELEWLLPLLSLSVALASDKHALCLCFQAGDFRARGASAQKREGSNKLHCFSSLASSAGPVLIIMFKARSEKLPSQQEQMASMEKFLTPKCEFFICTLAESLFPLFLFSFSCEARNACQAFLISLCPLHMFQFCQHQLSTLFKQLCFQLTAHVAFVIPHN
jgi:hypothetical protein